VSDAIATKASPFDGAPMAREFADWAVGKVERWEVKE
jgi:hypothetical protein